MHLKSHFADKKIIGYSAHSVEEAKSALALGATYCTISPIYPSQNKGKPLGIESLRSIPKVLAFSYCGTWWDKQIPYPNA